MFVIWNLFNIQISKVLFKCGLFYWLSKICDTFQAKLTRASDVIWDGWPFFFIKDYLNSSMDSYNIFMILLVPMKNKVIHLYCKNMKRVMVYRWIHLNWFQSSEQLWATFNSFNEEKNTTFNNKIYFISYRFILSWLFTD